MTFRKQNLFPTFSFILEKLITSCVYEHNSKGCICRIDWILLFLSLQTTRTGREQNLTIFPGEFYIYVLDHENKPKIFFNKSKGFLVGLLFQWYVYFRA